MTPTDPKAAEETAKLVRELRERGGILASERHVGQEVFMVKTAGAMGRAASRLEEQERQLAVARRLVAALLWLKKLESEGDCMGQGNAWQDVESLTEQARAAGLGADDGE